MPSGSSRTARLLLSGLSLRQGRGVECVAWGDRTTTVGCGLADEPIVEPEKARAGMRPRLVLAELVVLLVADGAVASRTVMAGQCPHVTGDHHAIAFANPWLVAHRASGSPGGRLAYEQRDGGGDSRG